MLEAQPTAGVMMDDNDVQDHIEALVAEEHRLHAAETRPDGHTASEKERLEQIKVELDRYWDLLRQRRAQEEFGRNPDGTSIRSEQTVEHYQQ
jgi:hypothetical protein